MLCIFIFLDNNQFHHPFTLFCTTAISYSNDDITRDHSLHYIILYSANFWQRKTLANLVNHWWFAKFYLTMSRDINKESKQTGICQTFPLPNIRAIRYIVIGCYRIRKLLIKFNSLCFSVCVGGSRMGRSGGSCVW